LAAKEFCRLPLSFGRKCADKEYKTLPSQPEDPSMISSVLGLVSGSTITAPNIDDVTNRPGASSAQTGPAADTDRITPRAASASPDLATVAMLLPPLGDFGPVADRSPRAKLQSAAESGLAEASHDTSARTGKYLSDPKHQALVAGSITAFAAVQALPGPDGAIDATVGAVSAAMYASAGPEHKVNIEKALGELKQYGAGATGAKSQGDLDAAAHHFAKFLEIGGPEAADAVGALAVSPVKLGGIAGKAATLSSDALSAGAKGLTNVGTAAQRGVDAANHWLGEVTDDLASSERSTLAPAGAGSHVDIGMVESRAMRPHASLEPSPIRSGATETDRRNVMDHEVAGGHTVLNHVGKTQAWLRDRLASRPDLKDASSFPNHATADFAQAALVKQNRSAIDQWLKTSSGLPLKLAVDTGRPVGRVLERDGKFTETTKARGYIVEDASLQGWHFLTSFPTK